MILALDWRYYRPAAEPLVPRPAGQGPSYSYKCKPCDVHWVGPESLGCFLCGARGVIR